MRQATSYRYSVGVNRSLRPVHSIFGTLTKIDRVDMTYIVGNGRVSLCMISCLLELAQCSAICRKNGQKKVLVDNKKA